MTILPLLFWSQHTWNIALSTEHGTEFSPNMVKLNSIARWVRRGSFREDTAPDHSTRVKEPGPFGHSLQKEQANSTENLWTGRKETRHSGRLRVIPLELKEKTQREAGLAHYKEHRCWCCSVFYFFLITQLIHVHCQRRIQAIQIYRECKVSHLTSPHTHNLLSLP